MKNLVHKKLIAFCFSIFTLSASAATAIQGAGINFGVEFDTNPTMAEDEQSIWRYIATPNYSINTVDGKNRWYGNGSLRLQRSSDRTISVDREDPTINLGWERGYDRGSFGLTANYSKNSTRFTEFDGTGIIVLDGSRITRAFGAEWSHLVTERVRSGLNAQYTTTQFSGGTFTDYSTKSVSGNLSYLWNENITPYFQLSYTDFQPEGSGLRNTKSQTYIAGINMAINPRTTLVTGAGVTHVSNVGNGWVANAALTYEGERYQVRSSIARSVSPSGIGNFQESDRISLGFSYDLSDVSRLGTDFLWRKNNSLNNTETTQLSGFYARDLSQFWEMRVSLQLRDRKSDNANTSGETLGFTISYNTPEF